MKVRATENLTGTRIMASYLHSVRGLHRCIASMEQMDSRGNPRVDDLPYCRGLDQSHRRSHSGSSNLANVGLGLLTRQSNRVPGGRLGITLRHLTMKSGRRHDQKFSRKI